QFSKSYLESLTPSRFRPSSCYLLQKIWRGYRRTCKAWVGSDQKPSSGFGKTPPSSTWTPLPLQKPLATAQRMRYGHSSKAVTAPAAGLRSEERRVGKECSGG